MSINSLKAESNFESLSETQFQNKLELANEKRKQLLARAAEFYDQDLYDLYASSALRFGADSQLQIAYINSSGSDYREALQNYQKFVSFQEEELKPVEQEIRAIAGEMRGIKEREAEARSKQRELQEEERFKAERKELVDKLYEALDAIYAQIPQEAHDAGMSTAIAMETYLPELVGKAQLIEYYIKKFDDVDLPSHLTAIKKDLKDRLDI